MIADDASTDVTVRIVREYIDQYPGQIRLVERGGQNGGTAAALNSAVAAASGDYICWLSADDLYLPDMLESGARFLE